MIKAIGSSILLTVMGLLYFNYQNQNKSNEVDNNNSEQSKTVQVQTSSSDTLHLKNEKLASFPKYTKIENDSTYKSSHKWDQNKLLEHFKDVEKSILTHIANVPPPKHEQLSVHASDIKIVRKSEHLAHVYISYNRAGDDFLGALQILEINYKKKLNRDDEDEDDEDEGLNHSKNLKFIDSILFTNMDVHSLNVDNKYLYLVGSSNNPKLKSPALLQIFELENNGELKKPLSPKTIDLPSFAATSVIPNQNDLYVSVGAKNGGLLHIQDFKSLPIDSTLSKHSDYKNHFWVMEDLRFLSFDQNSNTIYGVKGSPLELVSFDLQTRKVSHQDLDGGTIDHSKLTIEGLSSYLLLGLGEGGLSVFKKSLSETPTLFAHTSALELSTLSADLTVTNSASGNNRYIFSADGEGGSRLFYFHPLYPEGRRLKEIAHIQFEDGESVNSVKYFGGLLFMAVGKAGVNIVELNHSDQRREIAQEDD